MDNKLKETSWYLEEFLKQPKRVQELLLFNNLQNDIIPDVFCNKYKSPIEAIFITAFELYIKLNNKEQILLLPQREICTENKKYVVDFEFETDEYVNQFNTNKKVIIECDGHQFHQKTKEQVTKDNKREYDLKMTGYQILRFSGSQIYNEPFKCAEDTYNFIMKCIEEG